METNDSKRRERLSLRATVSARHAYPGEEYQDALGALYLSGFDVPDAHALARDIANKVRAERGLGPHSEQEGPTGKQARP